MSGDKTVLVAPSCGVRVDPARGVVIRKDGKPGGSLRPDGYVRFFANSIKKCVVVHRLIWEAANGPIPDGMEINHINGVRHDNRLANLEAVSPSENQRHAYRTGLRPMPRGTRNPRAKLSDADVIAIREAAEQGEPYKEIGARYGISGGQASAISRRIRWKHL